MNILLVSLDNSENAKIGGKHIHQELLKRGWIESNNEVDIIYPKGLFWIIKKIIRKILQIVKILNPYQHLKFSILSDKYEIEKSVKYAVFKNKYDFISVQDVLAAIAVKNILIKHEISIPVILTLHGYFARETVNYGNFSKSEEEKVLKFILNIENEAINFVDGIVTVDTRIKEYVLDNFNFKGPIQMICNAIDNSRFFPVQTFQKNAIKKQINLNENDNILLVARRLVKKNGVNYAVEAMKILRDIGLVDNLKLKLLIVGRGPEQNDIEDYIRLHDLSRCINVVGIIEHKLIDSYYKSADIILMPSTLSDDVEEATSLSMLEGLACGKIVIASSVGGLKEVITNNSNGILVDDKSPDQIAESVKQVLTDLNFREEIEKTAYEYAKSNCGYLLHSNKFLQFYFENFSNKNIIN